MEKFILKFSHSCHFSTGETLFFLAFFSSSSFLPASLPHFFVFTCIRDYTGHWLSNSIMSKVEVSWPVSLCAEMTSSARIESGENYEVGGEIQLSPVVRNQANQLHAGSFLLSSIEKLLLFIYSGSVTVPSRETPGPCQMSSGFHSLTCGWLM